MIESVGAQTTLAPSQMLRELADPHHALPALSLVLDEDQGFIETRYNMVLPSADIIGSVSTVSHRAEPVDNFSEMTIVNPRYIGHGYGLAAYVTAIGFSLDTGRAFRTDPQGIREAARKVWNRFDSLGIVQDRTRPGIRKGILTQYDFWITPPVVATAYAKRSVAV